MSKSVTPKLSSNKNSVNLQPKPNPNSPSNNTKAKKIQNDLNNNPMSWGAYTPEITHCVPSNCPSKQCYDTKTKECYGSENVVCVGDCVCYDENKHVCKVDSEKEKLKKDIQRQTDILNECIKDDKAEYLKNITWSNNVIKATWFTVLVMVLLITIWLVIYLK